MDSEASMTDTVELCSLKIGEKGRVEGMELLGTVRRRLLDLGFVEGTVVECVGKSPMGDPMAFLVRGAVIALREKDCRAIAVKRIGEGG